MKKNITLFLFALILMILPACGGIAKPQTDKQSPSPAATSSNQIANKDQEDIKSLEEAAKKEGKVVNYCYCALPDLKPAYDLFTKKYGVQVEHVQLRANDTEEKLKTESRVGKLTMDTITAGEIAMYSFKKNGYLTQYKPKDADRLRGTDKEGYYTGDHLNVFGFLVNTNRVPAADMPATWNDILNPKWKGKIIADDPSAFGGGNSVFTIFKEDSRFGEDYLKKLASLGMTLTRQRAENANAVARGEYDIYIPGLSSDLLVLKGAPVKWVAPSDIVPYTNITQGIVKNGPHPNSAKLLVSFFASTEGQTAVGGRFFPADPAVNPPIPEMKVSQDKMVTQTVQQFEKTDEYTQFLTTLFKK